MVNILKDLFNRAVLFNEVDGPLGSDSFYSATVVTAKEDTQVNELRKTFKHKQQLERTDTSIIGQIFAYKR